ncbi:hypothetical protein FBBAL38_04775 [Flavobacteria bacterium BAL38]|nr:hypothetical protein FBBAL38_04775 [Flavobacteria bacterium BAL38]
MKNSIFLLFSITFLFYGCKKENENYIEKIEVIREHEAPSPDNIVFSLKASKEVYEIIVDENIKRYILEAEDSIYINYTNPAFGIDKLSDNKIEFHFITPYFLTNRKRINYFSEEKVLENKLNSSKDLKLKLFVGDKVFEFKNK